LQVGGGCDAGESEQEPLFLRPRRAIGHGTGPSGSRVPSVSRVSSHLSRRRRSWFWTRQYAKVQSMTSLSCET